MRARGRTKQAVCEHLKYVSQDFAEFDRTGRLGSKQESGGRDGLDIVCDIANIPEPDGALICDVC
jgi:hypothetical protein